jgi:DHA1 family multidrug resistance protein-like MFS transporter
MKPSQSQNRRSVLILFFTLIVVMLGFGMVIPILPFYIKSFGASGSTMGALMATFGLLQFLFAPIWGSLSDRYGRKPILMIGILGNAVSQLFFGLSTELWMLFAARALAGILSSATLPTAMAYISDTTSERDRGGGMGIIGAAMGIGMVIGPGLGGLLAGQSLSLPFFLAAFLSVVALLLVWFILPEPERSRPEIQGKIRGPQLKQMLQALAGPMGVLFFMSFLLTFGLTNFEGIFGLYSVERYGYNPQQVGGILMVVGLISAVIQGGLTGPLTRRFGEVTIIRASLISSAFAFGLMTQARNLPQVLLTVSFFVLSNAMLNPAVNSLISRRTLSAQGITMGLANSFLSLGRIVGPLWAGFVFDQNLNLPYWTGALIMLIGFGISLFSLKSDPVGLQGSRETEQA